MVFADSTQTMDLMPTRLHNPLLLGLVLIVSVCLVIYQGWDMVAQDGEPILQGNDDTGYFLWLNSWVVDRDNDLVNNLTELETLSDERRTEWISETHPSTGKVLNKYPVGWALLNWPIYETTHWIYGFFNPHATGTEPIYFLSIWAFQLLLAGSSLGFAYQILTHFLSKDSAQWAILTTWLASPLVYYQTARLGLIHNQAFFLTTVMIWLSLRLKSNQSYTSWLALGFASSLLIITRPTSIAYVIIPAYFGILRVLLQPKQTFRYLLAGILAGCIPISVQLLVWKDVYGSWLVFSYHGEPFFLVNPNFWGSLFSDRHGLFNWHPYLLLGAVGWIYGSLFKQVLPKVWIASFAVIAYLNSAWWCWWFGSSFGNRAYEGAILFFMAGIGYLFRRLEGTKWPRMALLIVSTCAIAWNLFLLSQYLTQRFDRSLPVSYLERLLG